MSADPSPLLITPEERQALQLLAQEGTAGDIACCLGVSTSDVSVSLKRLFSKLGASNRAEAIASAFRRGLLTLP